MKKLERLKSLLSHQLKDQSTAVLLEKLADIALKKLDPELKCEKTVKNVQQQSAGVEPETSHVSAPKSPSDQLIRYIPAPIKRAIWRRNQGQCSAIDPKSKRRCASRRFLKIDHIEPFAHGGSSTDPSNLRLLCQAHNQARAGRKSEINVPPGHRCRRKQLKGPAQATNRTGPMF